MKIYVTKLENRIAFKIKTGYYQLLTTETMKFLESSKNKITKDENGKNVPHLEITEEVLIHCNIFSNHNQHNKFVPNKSFCQLQDISPKTFIFLKTFNSEFSYIPVWFTDQNSYGLLIISGRR